MSNYINVNSVSTFFSKSTRNSNDATNKIREQVLKLLGNPPEEYLENEEFGNNWRTLQYEWNNALKNMANYTDIPQYTSTDIQLKGGRKFNYDADIIYYNEPNCVVAKRKIEFKNGCSNIGSLPQFLSLQAKNVGLFSETYDKFWYDNYLDKYIACDIDITQPKPPREEYINYVTNTTYSITPFFDQLKNRETFFKIDKNTVVNNSITDYLTQYGHTINIEYFTEKVRATQTDKIYLLWYNGKFYIDKISDKEMSGIYFHSIKNGNVIELKSASCNTMYSLLLRWRNHKGILNPAWQISMKRISNPDTNNTEANDVKI